MRGLLHWAVFFLVAYMCWQVGPPYLHNRQFADQLEEVARRGHSQTQATVVQRTVELAQSLDIPLTAAGVTVRRIEHHTFVDATYTHRLELLPGWTYDWTVTASVDGYVVRPATASDYIGTP